MKQTKILLLIVSVLLIFSLILFQKFKYRPEGTPLTVMTFNVGTFNGKPADISRIASIAAKPEAPDMLILQEVHGEESCRYLAERIRLPFWVFSGYQAGDGLAVISRFPVKIVKVFSFNPYGALMVDID